jgi:hypothetical protein
MERLPEFSEKSIKELKGEEGFARKKIKIFIQYIAYLKYICIFVSHLTIENMEAILKTVAEKLNEKFNFINDFKVYVDGNRIRGGFYYMNYSSSPESRYPFHEIFCKYSSIEESEIDLAVTELSEIVISKLIWQKDCDEMIASETGKSVKYKYDYSILND